MKYKQDSNLNHNVVILTTQEDNYLFRKYKELGVNIFLFDFENRYFSIGSLLKNIFQTFKLALLIRKSKITVLHSHDFFPAFVSRIACILSFTFFLYRVKKVIITLHIVFTWLKPFHNFINRVLSLVTYKIVCLSNAIKNYSLSKDKINARKYVIINTGIDTTLFVKNDALRETYCKEFGYTANDIIIGNIGVLSIRKGQIYLLRALKDLLIKYPNLKLLIIGSERSHEFNIKEEIKNFIIVNNMQNSVKIIEPRDDIHEVYNVFDIFCMPSVTEGLSACSIEALLMERLCLFSDIEPFKELVEDGKQGFLFKNKDSVDLRNKLDFIIANKASLSYIKEAAKKSALGKYDVRDMVKKYEDLYLHE